MNQLLLNRLEAIQQSLRAHHNGGKGMPSAMVGSERERLIGEYLSQVLPSIYRFGTGSITDSLGVVCGQIDTVMETPFGPSFPMPSGKEKLYPAESVASVIEVKSNLCSQWDEIESVVSQVKKLRRYMGPGKRHVIPEFEPHFRIPCYAVGYTGHKTLRGLYRRLLSTTEDSRPNGVLVIDSGCFVGAKICAVGAWGLLGFASELLARAQTMVSAHPDFSGYGRFDEVKNLSED